MNIPTYKEEDGTVKIAWHTLVPRLIQMRDIKAKTIYNQLPFARTDLAAIITPELEQSLADGLDPLWALAVAHFIVSRIIINTRTLRQHTSFNSSTGAPTNWGEGSFAPSSIDDLLKMADHFKKEADKICISIQKQNANTTNIPGWYVI